MGYQSKDGSELRSTGWRPDIPCMTLTKSRLIALALTLVLTTACDAAARAADGLESCVTGHRFEPGPIVNGRPRQPTPREIEARTQQLRAWKIVRAGSCLAAPRGNEATIIKPPHTGPVGHGDGHLETVTVPALPSTSTSLERRG